MIIVRLYEPQGNEISEGFDVIKSLYAGYFNDGLTRAEYFQELSEALEDQNFFCLFAKHGQTVVGAILFRSIPFIFSGQSLWIHSIIVHEKYRRQGIGSKLFEACRDKAKELGLQRIYFNSASEELNPDYAGVDTFHEKNNSQKIGSFFVNEIL